MVRRVFFRLMINKILASPKVSQSSALKLPFGIEIEQMIVNKEGQFDGVFQSSRNIFKNPTLTANGN